MSTQLCLSQPAMSRLQSLDGYTCRTFCQLGIPEFLSLAQCFTWQQFSLELCCQCPCMPYFAAYLQSSLRRRLGGTLTRATAFRLSGSQLVSCATKQIYITALYDWVFCILFALLQNVVFQRLVVAASCAVFYILAIDIPLPSGVRTGLVAVVTLFACVEKLCSILNLVSVEKDWVSQCLSYQQQQLYCHVFTPLDIMLTMAT